MVTGSILPSQVVISTPILFYPNYSLRFEYLFSDDTHKINNTRLINAFKDYGLLHSGLSVLIDSILLTGTQLNFSFTIINSDLSNLLILDIDKMGPGLFHYFTNGLMIRDLSYNVVFSSNIEHQEPSPGNIWEAGWMTQIESGGSRQFTIDYTIDSSLNPGEYEAGFEFPGLGNRVKRNQLIQGNARIWLGSVRATRRIIIY